MKLADIAKTATARKLVVSGRPPSRPTITKAEQALGVAFSRSLHEYLESFGWLTIEDDVLFGLGRGIARHRHLVDATTWERRADCPLPRHLIPLRNDGAGNLDCVDVRTDRVVFWNHERGPTQRPEQVAATLRGWLAALVRDHVRWKPERDKLARLLARWERVGTAKLSKADRAALETFFDGEIPPR